jgi:hypothetical protein
MRWLGSVLVVLLGAPLTRGDDWPVDAGQFQAFG